MFFSSGSERLEGVVKRAMVVTITVSNLSLTRATVIDIRHLLLLESLTHRGRRGAFKASAPLPAVSCCYFAGGISRAFKFVPEDAYVG